MKADPENLSGRLRDRVTLIAPPLGPDRDSLGDTSDVTSVEVTTWANVKDLSGREMVYAQQVVAEVTTLVEIRWRPGVSRFKSLLFGSRKLNIDAAIDPENLKIHLLLYCREDPEES